MLLQALVMVANCSLGTLVATAHGALPGCFFDCVLLPGVNSWVIVLQTCTMRASCMRVSVPPFQTWATFWPDLVGCDLQTCFHADVGPPHEGR